ncbi:MAG: gluconate 2-dehydrogenase subunit 3 family protein [Vicinamibacterales bacterium]
MASLERRRVLQWLGTAPVAAGFAWSATEVEAAASLAQTVRSGGATPGAVAAYQPKFFTPHEWETVRALADAIIPRDERSGSATDAGVPEFIDFILIDEPRLAHETGRQTAMRGGLAWVDLECQRRFDKTFATCTDAERTAVLDDISEALPEETAAFEYAVGQPPQIPALAPGRAFFASFRDLVATGFWTSRMGIDDLQYVGNRAVPEWKGCPKEALEKLGVSYPSV